MFQINDTYKINPFRKIKIFQFPEPKNHFGSNFNPLSLNYPPKKCGTVDEFIKVSFNRQNSISHLVPQPVTILDPQVELISIILGILIFILCPCFLSP